MRTALRKLARRAACAWWPRTLVLAYHHVGDPTKTAPWVTVSAAQFAAQMAYLAANRLVVPLDQLLGELKRGRVPRGGSVVITFDDAAQDTWTTAFPVLRQHGLPATLFVPTGLVDSKEMFWWDWLSRLSRAAAAKGRDLGNYLVSAGVLENGRSWTENTLWRRLRYLQPAQRKGAFDEATQWLNEDTYTPTAAAMDWDHVAALDASGLFTLGAHTVSHPVLAALSDEQLTTELVECRGPLAKMKSFRNVFAYPYGDASAIGARVEQAVRQAGYEVAFSTDEVALTGQENRMSLGRVCVDDMPLAEFVWAIDHHLGR